MQTAIFFGLLSALSYGITDYFSRVAGRAVGIFRALYFGQLIALAALSIWIWVTHGFKQHSLTAFPIATLIAIGSSVILIASAAVLNHALVVGRLAVVAPVAAAYGAVTTVISMLSGEPLTRAALSGVGFTVLGVCLVSVPSGGRHSGEAAHPQTGLLYAAIAAIGYGVGFWIQSYWIVPKLGPLVPVWLTYLTGVVTWLILWRTNRVSLAPPHGLEWLSVITWGLSSVGGYVTLTLGFETGATAIIVVLSSAASAVTVLLGVLIERTRVSPIQWTAILVILIGLGLMRA